MARMMAEQRKLITTIEINVPFQLLVFTSTGGNSCNSKLRKKRKGERNEETKFISKKLILLLLK